MPLDASSTRHVEGFGSRVVFRAPTTILDQVITELEPHISATAPGPERCRPRRLTGSLSVWSGPWVALLQVVLRLAAEQFGSLFESDQLPALNRSRAIRGKRFALYASRRGPVLVRIARTVIVVEHSEATPVCQIARNVLAVQMLLPSLLERGAVTLHAAGVSIGHDAIAFCAAKGSGKTTFQFKLIERYGVSFLTADRLLVTTERSQPCAYGWVWGVNLRPTQECDSLLGRLYEASNLPAYRMTEEGDVRVRVTKAALRRARVPLAARARLKAIVVLRFVPDRQDLMFEPVAEREAEDLLMTANQSLGPLDTGWLWGDDVARSIGDLRGALATVPIFRLEYGPASEERALDAAYRLLVT